MYLRISHAAAYRKWLHFIVHLKHVQFCSLATTIPKQTCARTWYLHVILARLATRWHVTMLGCLALRSVLAAIGCSGGRTQTAEALTLRASACYHVLED